FLAGLQAGLFPSLAAIAASWKLDRAFTPSEDAAARDRRYAGWKAAVARVRTAP
ncbi:MAG: glycerol kinase, partial [Rhodospirillales bacterium]|nr:glycerol kinase [Rhodospirillales bacterium]